MQTQTREQMMQRQIPPEPRTGLYLPPDQLEPNDANERARPGETAEERQRRVEMTARSIAATGQIHPVLVVELDSDTQFDEEGVPLKRYEYVDGGARVDAIRLLNSQIADDAKGFSQDVWCSIVDPSLDLFRLALSANIHRTQNSILQMSEIIQDVRQRNDWTSRGGQQKVCEYLGLLQSQVSGFEKIARAPKSVRDLIQSGEVTTVDAALKLMSVKPEELPLVTKRAQELAQTEKAEEKPKPKPEPAKPAKKKKHTPEDTQAIADKVVEILDYANAPAKSEDVENDLPPAETSTPAPKPAKVTAKHVQQATREVSSKIIPLTRAELIACFGDLRALPYPQSAKNFIVYFVDVHVAGKGSDKEFEKLFDAAVGRIWGTAPVHVPGEENEELSQKPFDLKKVTGPKMPAKKKEKKVVANKAAAKGKKK